MICITHVSGRAVYVVLYNVHSIVRGNCHKYRTEYYTKSCCRSQRYKNLCVRKSWLAKNIETKEKQQHVYLPSGIGVLYFSAKLICSGFSISISVKEVHSLNNKTSFLSFIVIRLFIFIGANFEYV